jgi:eukaryotic-like serine/threonine-protein kinase
VEPKTLISGKYRLLRRLGEGGMAEVWSARNELTQRDFAIKLILPSLSQNREALDRFLQEAKATARLRHPSLVDVFDVGWTADGRPFLVMELLFGESLEALLARRRKLTPLWTALVLAPIARALETAHRAGIVHRDLSSANLFLSQLPGDELPTPKVLDFGVSKLLEHADRELVERVRTESGAVLGSPAYMSPEQARGAETVDARSDIWALGVLLYECLTGETPFRARNYNALMLAILSRAHPPIYERLPRLDAELAELVEGCLIKDREARVQRAHEVAEQLEAIALRLCGGVAPDGRQRRASDRLSIGPRSSLLPRALLPPAALPVGVRLWRRLRAGATPRTLGIAGALGGTALGMVIGVQIARSKPSASAPIASLQTHAERQPGEPEVVPVPSTAPEAIPSAVSRGDPPDLVNAVARGLGIEKRQRPQRKQPPPQPRSEAVAFVPRKNPY